MITLELEKLSQVVSVLSPVQRNFFSENCIVAFEINNHSTGCELSVAGDKTEPLTVHWSKQVKKSGYKEEKKIIEHAAEAIAFLLTPLITEFSVIEEATIGTGFDYWLGYDESHKDYDPKNFFQARLEISGIKIESNTNTVQKRVAEKKQQTNKSEKLKLPAYISVTEFATPKTYFGKK